MQKEKRPFPSAFPLCIFFVKYAPEIVPCGTLFPQDLHRPGEKFGPAFAAGPGAGVLVVDSDHAAGLGAQLHLQRLLPVQVKAQRQERDALSHTRACFKTRKLCAKCQYGKLII